jgi:glutamyl-Q tRNA(Asp) synthetase
VGILVNFDEPSSDGSGSVHLNCRAENIDNVESIPARYVGRFAPSPTGPLHLGSLVTALASYLEAKANQGKWLVRIEDLDTPRCSPQWAEHILRTLSLFGFRWDGPVMYQSDRARQAGYEHAFTQLQRDGLVYPCGCSRKELAETQSSGTNGELRYPGTCRAGLAPGREPRAWRLRVKGAVIAFEDRLQGRTWQQLESTIGDFTLCRADGLFSYQLAVVVDDAAQGVTDVVRGVDLLISTPRQIYLQRLLGLPEPSYMHLPLVRNHLGQKLSKQTGAAPVRSERAVEVLWQALQWLGQQPPEHLKRADLREVWAWATKSWNPGALRMTTAYSSKPD